MGKFHFSNYRYEDKIKKSVEEIGSEDVEWIDLAQDRDKWRSYKHGNNKSVPPKNAEKFLNNRGNSNFSRISLFHECSSIFS